MDRRWCWTRTCGRARAVRNGRCGCATVASRRRHSQLGRRLRPADPMNGLLLFGGLFLLGYAIVVVIAFRRPLFARIAIREATRRPWQSALVVAGLMIGSGAILVSQVIQNSTDDSLIAGAFQSWGRVDLTVAAPDNSYFDSSVAQAL